MKKRLFTIVLITLLLLALSLGAWASTGQVQKILHYNNIKLKLNGASLEPKDVNGNEVEPFIIDGTTYLPVRAISEALGLEVSWDDETKTVILSGQVNAQTPQASDQDVYHTGDTWTVPGLWSLTITGVREMSERNSFSDLTPAAVYLVDYTYSNLGYEDSYMGGLFVTLDNTVVDHEGYMGYSYPNSVTRYPQITPVGATCTAQDVIAVDHPGSFTVMVSMYDSNYKTYSASFEVEVP